MTNSAQTPSRPANVDKPGPTKAQDGAQAGAPPADGLSFDAVPVSGRFGAALLVKLRWLILLLELAILLAAAYGFHLRFPIEPCLAVVAVSAALNLGFSYGPLAKLKTTGTAYAAQLGFNIIQATVLLTLTGGVSNPFCVLLITPASLAAATLKDGRALAVCLLAAASVVFMAIWSWPVPWPYIGGPMIPPLMRYTSAVAILAGIGVTAGYAWGVAREAARMELALNFTQTVLAREQRLSALGGLAAAAAHELGTPLATISIVAKEMVREIAGGSLREDAELLVSQAERCREILRRLTEEPETDDAVHARMTLLQLVNEVIESHRETTVRVEALVAGPPNTRPPEIRRMPEVLHAMTSLVENAVDFARSEVLVSVRFDEASILVEVRDDGPGFAADILVKLGQPYVTSRPGAERSRSGHIGMGLGFFIAKTLLERTGAAVDFRNGRGGGAIIAARWPRAAIEAPPGPGGFELGAFDSDEFAAGAN
jgi:two-component system sensor histidine kinase RegB